jgi:7-keto-8-aminopelargonate synthetase-like enzyme
MRATTATPAAAAQAAADALHDLEDHLSRYADPGRLARHLRSRVHDRSLTAAQEDSLAALRRAHAGQHRKALAAARAALAAAEDAAADAAELAR